MTSQNDSDYLRARAIRERAIASTCADNIAALVHLRMADEYERRVQSMTIPGSGFTTPA